MRFHRAIAICCKPVRKRLKSADREVVGIRPHTGTEKTNDLPVDRSLLRECRLCLCMDRCLLRLLVRSERFAEGVRCSLMPSEEADAKKMIQSYVISHWSDLTWPSCVRAAIVAITTDSVQLRHLYHHRSR
jgi:hypothetical protein